jgi:DNA-binding winged helix-turn-helix (wHTH) protein
VPKRTIRFDDSESSSAACRVRESLELCEFIFPSFVPDDHTSELYPKDVRLRPRGISVSANFSSRIVRFSTFEVNLHTGELRQQGQKIKLQEQPLQVLAALLERPGEIVTREELRSKLWSADTFVDFDHSLNAAIKRLRDALGESAETPIFIETLARRGYRFIAPVVQDAASQSEAHPRVLASGTLAVTQKSSDAVKVTEGRPPSADRKVRNNTIVASVLTVVLVGVLAWLGGSVRFPRVLNTRQITHDGIPKQDVILTDGSRLYFIETYGARTLLAQASVTGGDTSVIRTPFPNIAVTDISPDHSQLLARNSIGTELEAQFWTLPLAAGTPRPLAEVVGRSAVWSPDGRQLAFAKESDVYTANADGTNPRKLVSVSGTAHWIRFSPDGSRLRFTLALQGDSLSIWEVRVDGSDFHPALKGSKSPSSECCGGPRRSFHSQSLHYRQRRSRNSRGSLTQTLSSPSALQSNRFVEARPHLIVSVAGNVSETTWSSQRGF